MKQEVLENLHRPSKISSTEKWANNSHNDHCYAMSNNASYLQIPNEYEKHLLLIWILPSDIVWKTFTVNLDLAKWYCQYQRPHADSEHYRTVWPQTHNDVTDKKNSNGSFEGLDIHYHSLSYRTDCDTNDNVDLQTGYYSIYKIRMILQISYRNTKIRQCQKFVCAFPYR